MLVVAAGRRADGTVPADRSDAEPDVAIVARPVIADAARLVTGAATEIVPSVPIFTLLPCLTPPKTELVATGKVYEVPPDPPDPPVAERTPEVIANPDPTMIAPAVLEVAAGSLAAGTVPADRSEADPLVAIAANPVIVLAAWL
jgi:hypothetical protein